MKNLTIGPSYFRNERRAYSDWKIAVFTEILQNSIDSVGCSRIDIDIVQKENETIITAKDNGSGMSRETLENIFLVIGETSKSTGETIGGFGIARNLICFGMEQYKIKSFDYVVEGKGASYTINKSEEFVKGCIFEITAEKYDWLEKLHSVLEQSSINQAIFINGEKYSNDVHRGRMVRNLTFGDLYVNKSAKNPGVFIRCKGLKMFSKYAPNLTSQVILEIHHDKAKEILTSNRNGLNRLQDDELQAFLTELACDSSSSLRNKTRHFKRLVNKGTGFKTCIKKKNQISENSESAEETNIYSEFNKKKVIDEILNGGGNPTDYGNLPIYLQDPILQNMMILNESNDIKKVQLINNFYHPEKWTSRDSTRYQLLREWFAICQIVMDEVSNWKNEEFFFSVGWIFTDNTDGEGITAAHAQDSGVHYLLINPIDENNKLKYSVNNKGDWYSLIVLACHEATHCLHHYHNEDFSSMFTHLMMRVMKRKNELFDAIKTIKQ